MAHNPTTGMDDVTFPSTSYNNPDLPHISRCLADVLDRCGFSEDYRECRVKVSVMMQMFGVLRMLDVNYGESCSIRMGSTTEGTTAVGMGSDVDSLFFSTSVKAHCNKDTVETAGVVLFRDETTPAGYTKLQPVYQGRVTDDPLKIKLNTSTIGTINIEADQNGSLVVTHFIHQIAIDASSMKHGPADTFTDIPNHPDLDAVRSFLCDTITNEMEEWCMRERTPDWLSKETRDLFKTLGCFVVGVGHPSSPENNLEWRMSFSLQEQHLMRRLNPTQYHCFMLLKLIKKFLIKPQFGDVLTSYHCKTLLFYTIERHEHGIWIPEKLISCLQQCLLLLHEWIANKYIPNYFIPKENMFVKMKAALKGNYDEFKLFVANMSNDWEFLFHITFNGIGNDFLQILALNGHNSYGHVIESMSVTPLDSQIILSLFSTDCLSYTNELHNTLDYLDVVLAILQSSRTCTSSRCTTFEETISQLHKQWFANRVHTLITSERFRQLTESFQYAVEDNEIYPRTFAVMAMKSFLQTLLGSVSAAKYFQTGDKQYLIQSDSYLELGKSFSPLVSLLIKATVMLKQSALDGNNGAVNYAINAADIAIKEKECMCGCYAASWIYHSALGTRKREHTIFDGNAFKNTEATSSLIIPTCFHFRNFQVDILPQPLIFEAYRSFRLPTDSLTLAEEKWVARVVVDPIMYLYYLQFLNNQHNHPGEAAVALHKFETTLFERLGRSDWPGHTDTWLNVLGNIFLRKGWTRLALSCFKCSYGVRRHHNAVRWHVMFLLFSPSRGTVGHGVKRSNTAAEHDVTSVSINKTRRQ